MLCTGRRLLWRVCTRAAYTRTLSCTSEGQSASIPRASAEVGEKHTGEGSSASEQVLQYWHRELLCNHSESNTLDVWSEEGAKVRELVTVAVRLRQGKVAAVLPEEVGQSLSGVYVALALVTSKQTACMLTRMHLCARSLTGLLAGARTLDDLLSHSPRHTGQNKVLPSPLP